jgi:hypothetical protein
MNHELVDSQVPRSKFSKTEEQIPDQPREYPKGKERTGAARRALQP